MASPWASAPSGPVLPPPPSVPHRWVPAEASVPPLLSASPWGPWGRTDAAQGAAPGAPPPADRQQPARFWHPKHPLEGLNVCSLITVCRIRAIPGAQRPPGRDAPAPSSVAGPDSGARGYRRRRAPYRAGSDSFWPGPALRNFRSALISWKNLRIATEPGPEPTPERYQPHPPSTSGLLT